MSRTAEGSLATPESTPSHSSIKTTPCPAHLLGHPTITVSLLSPVSPSFASQRHQSPSTPVPAHASSLKQSWLAHGLDASQDSKSAFDLRLWSLVPPNFRPRVDQMHAPQPSQRPTAADTIIDLPHTPQNDTPIHSSGSEVHSSGSERHPVVIDSQETSSKRRRYGPSRRSRESSASAESTLELATLEYRDRNPFEMDESEELHDLQVRQQRLHLNDSSPEPTFRLHRLQPTGDRQHRSQQAVGTSKSTLPPPVSRHRSMDLDITPTDSPILSPARSNDSPSEAAKRRHSGVFSGLAVSGSSGYKERRISIPTSSSGVDKDDPGDNWVSRPSSTDIFHGMSSQTGRRTPLGSKEGAPFTSTSGGDVVLDTDTPATPIRRRYSISSLSTKSPSSVDTVIRSPYRRHSFANQDSPLMRTPTRPAREPDIQDFSSDESPRDRPSINLTMNFSGGIEWSSSLETPPKEHTGPGRWVGTIDGNRRRSWRELSPTGSMEDLPRITGVLGWSSSLETPPKKKEPHLKRSLSNGVLEQLRGAPHLFPTFGMGAKVGSSSVSPLSVDEGDGDQRRSETNRKGDESPDAVERGKSVDSIELAMAASSQFGMDARRSLEANIKPGDGFIEEDEVGFTLPNSMVEALEQDSPVLPSQEILSQILPDTQTGLFDGISPTIASNSSQELPQQRSQVDLETVSETYGYQEGPSKRMSAGEAGAPFGNEGMSTTQDMTLEGLQLDSWGMTSSMEGDRSIRTDQNRNTQRTDRNNAEPTPDDDFDSLRYSQLDEAFSATQASPQEYRQDQTAPVKAKVPDPSSSDMEQDTSSFSASHTSGNGSTLGGFYTTRTRQNQLVGGGFTSNWEKILPTPPGSKPTEATGSGNGHLSSSGIVNTAIAMPEGFVQHDPFNATGGFRSAGKGSLPTISKTALERAARMFQDEDLGMESTMASTEDHSGQSRMVGFKSAGKGPLPMISKASREKAAQIFQDEDLMGPAMESTSDHPVQPRMGGGFKSAGKGSLPMISKASIEKAARMFRDEDQMGSAMESTNDHSGRPRMTGGFKSAGKGSLPTISNASREKAARMFQDEDLMGSTKESANDHPGKLRMAGGFKSAGGGSLPTISKTSLERAAQMFQDEDVGTGSRMELTDNHPVQPTMAGGFKSAGKGQLPLISKASLERAAQMFQDEDVGIGSRMELTDDHLDQSRMVGGFSSAGKGSLPMISKASIERAERMFQDEDLGIRSTMAPTDDHSGQSRMTGGFKSVGKGPLPAISKASIEKAARMFQDEDPWTASTMVTMDDCSDGSRTMNSGSDASSLNTSMSEKTISSTQQSQASVFSGFSNGKGGALTPISKAAQVHARSLLEMDEPRTTTVMRKPPMNPALSSNGSQSSMATGSWPSGPSTIQQQPSISPFMSNLMRKTMRAPGSSLAGKHTPKTKPFKSPMRLVQPTKKPSDYIGVGGSSNDMVNYENTSAGKAQTMDKRPVGKRTTLHPNAHIMSTSSMDPPTGLQRTTHNTEPSYTPLFNLQERGPRVSFRRTLGCPHQLDHRELLDLGVPEAAVEMTLADARSYHFGTWGAEEAYRDLIARGAIPNLLSKVWVSNHYGLIVWKLACYIRTWPQHFLSQQPPWFCPTRVLDQLAYRYEREINLAERPALRKIVERDESAGRHMVLCIASVAMEHSEEAIEDVLKVTVTDGWYVLPATLDPCLTRAVERGRLKVGSKVHVCRAKLSGAEDGVAILELAGAGSTATAVSIALQANSTRLARWDTKLGFQSTPIVWTTQLRSISPEGGLVPGLDVVVLRKYPVLYMETMEDGVTKVKRTEREESRAAEAHTELMQKRYQDMVEEVERRHGTGANPVQIQNEIEAKTSELMAKASTRDVVPVFIIRVGNYAGNLSHRDINDNGRHQEALVTFWHSDHTPYQEGHRARITSLIAKRTSREFGLEDVLQLTSTRTTTVKDMPTDPVAMDLTKYQPREVIPCEAIEYLDQGTEVDLAVIILAVSDRVISSNRVYMVVTDSSRELVLVEHQVSANQISPSFLKVHARVLMANVRFKMRDYKLGIDVVQSLQNYTRITAASSSSSSASGWPVYAQPSLQQLNDMVNSRRPQGAMEDKNGLVKLMSRANSLIADMQQPCL